MPSDESSEVIESGCELYGTLHDPSVDLNTARPICLGNAMRSNTDISWFPEPRNPADVLSEYADIEDTDEDTTGIRKTSIRQAIERGGRAVI